MPGSMTGLLETGWETEGGLGTRFGEQIGNREIPDPS